MRCPTLEELPAPPPGKTGWPWTEESEQLPDKMSDGSPWPKISIVTPSYNQGQFIEETIRSVLLQGYPNLEYIIIDGDSTDGSVEIIKKYEPWLDYWVSEPDQGQVYAINKGLAKTTGQIIAYLNSDDCYQPNAFRYVARLLTLASENKWICGKCAIIDANSNRICINEPEIPENPEEWIARSPDYVYHFPQPAVFWLREVSEELGNFCENLDYSFDYEYWVRMLIAGHKPLKTEKVLASFRRHNTSKTSTANFEFLRDELTVAEMYFDQLSARGQKAVIKRKRSASCLIAVTQCWQIAKEQTRRAARRALWRKILRHPYFIKYRIVWGAFRRWYGLCSDSEENEEKTSST